MQTTATGRPRQSVPLLARLALLLVFLVAFLEGAARFLSTGGVAQEPWFGLLRRVLAVPHRYYAPVRSVCLQHPIAATLVGVAGTAVLLLTYRRWLLFWHNEIAARITGTHFAPEKSSFPVRQFNLLDAIRLRPKGSYFVGMTPHPRLFGWSWRPTYISQRQKTMHRHVIGKTGSGKTLSVLLLAILRKRGFLDRRPELIAAVV